MTKLDVGTVLNDILRIVVEVLKHHPALVASGRKQHTTFDHALPFNT